MRFGQDPAVAGADVESNIERFLRSFLRSLLRTDLRDFTRRAVLVKRRILAQDGEMGQEKGCGGMEEKVADPKTGEFHLRVQAGPEASEQEKRWMRGTLLRKLAERLEAISADNREYEVVVRVGRWHPSGDEWVGEELELAFTVALVDATAAEVGELVSRLPIRVPEDRLFIGLGGGFGEASGYLFERGQLGWKRIE